MLRFRMAVVLEPGKIIAGRYRLDRVLGQGGMGVVWAATHAVTRRTVAMKFVRSALQQKTELRGRLLREAHAAAAVRHPNVVEILDVFELDADTPVIVMTLLQGETLGQRLARDPPLSLEETASCLLPAISAIGTAHARGVVHRDLKPDNIYLSDGSDGAIVKVLDFGIAKLQSGDHTMPDAMSTQTGSTLGTPSYMAPEQAAGERDVDHRADIWALGVIAYECLSGVRPIEGENAAQVMMRLMTVGITPLARVTRGLPDEVTSLVDRMLCRERTRRCPDLHDAQRVFSRYTEVTALDFGAPGSELSTAFEGDGRRSSAPVVYSPQVPSANDSATLVNDTPRFADRPAPVARRRTNRFLALSVGAVASIVGFFVWRSAGTRAALDPATPTPNGVVQVPAATPAATVGSGASVQPPSSASSDEARNPAVAPPAPPRPMLSASPILTSTSTKRQPGANPSLEPSSASSSPTTPSAASPSPTTPPSASSTMTSAAPGTARTETKPPRHPGGLVVDAPF